MVHKSCKCCDKFKEGNINITILWSNKLEWYKFGTKESTNNPQKQLKI